MSSIGCNPITGMVQESVLVEAQYRQLWVEDSSHCGRKVPASVGFSLVIPASPRLQGLEGSRTWPESIGPRAALVIGGLRCLVVMAGP